MVPGFVGLFGFRAQVEGSRPWGLRALVPPKSSEYYVGS